MSDTSGLRGKLARSFTLWSKVFGLLRYSNRRLAIIVFCVTVLEIGFSLGALVAVKSVVQVLSQPGDMRDEIPAIFASVSLVLGLFLAGRIMQSVANYFRSAQGFVVSDYVNQALQERAVALDLAFYDSPHYYDGLERARQAGPQRPAQVIANAFGVFRGGAMLAGIAVLLVTVDWLLLPISLMAVALILVVQVRFTRERFERQKQLVQIERRAFYADWLMTSVQYAKELRLWDLGAHLRKVFMDLRKTLRAAYLRIERRKAISEALVSIVGTLLFIGAGGLVLWRFSMGAATISDLVLVLLLLLRAESMGRAFVSSLSRLYDDQLFLSQLFRFLDLQPVIARPGTVYRPIPPATEDGVQLDGVSFSYPGAETPAVHDVSLQIRPGRFTALVGGNGSGKTTLIKLLCRLYDPQEGRVLYNGVDVRGLDPVAYRRQFSVIFQDFVQFAYSARDNVQLADLERWGDAARLVEAARLAGAHDVLEALPKGYDTILSRMFDGGIELSGGQWQKVALARAMFPESKFIIMDEPTSAIDPNAEAALFEGFRDKIEGRGALVISHRLSTIRQADYTYVMHEGRIVEEGTHDALIAHDGRYAQMFERQGRGYRT